MRRFGSVLAALAVTCGAYHCGPSRADLLQCSYPNTMFFFSFVPGLGRVTGFVCNGPTEMNSAHWHSEYGSGGLTLNLGANFAVPGLQGGNGSTSQAGVEVVVASDTWRCPDERYECEEPAIIGTWNKERPKPTRAVPVRVAPLAALGGAPWPPTTDVNIKVAWPPESPPHPITDYPNTAPPGDVHEQAPLPIPLPLAPPAPAQPPVVPPEQAPDPTGDPLPNTRQGG